jgi:hypothetical protein
MMKAVLGERAGAGRHRAAQALDLRVELAYTGGAGAGRRARRGVVAAEVGAPGRRTQARRGERAHGAASRG